MDDNQKSWMNLEERFPLVSANRIDDKKKFLSRLWHQRPKIKRSDSCVLGERDFLFARADSHANSFAEFIFSQTLNRFGPSASSEMVHNLDFYWSDKQQTNDANDVIR